MLGGIEDPPRVANGAYPDMGIHDPGKHRRTTLLKQVLKLLEGVLDELIQKRIELETDGELQG